jgi:hypothetical protein
MMEETIDTIDDRADVEWKFARSRLYMEFIRDGKKFTAYIKLYLPNYKWYLLLKGSKMVDLMG